MKKLNFITVALLVFSAPSLQAVPILQVGACTDSSCTDYIANSTQGSDEDTAFASGNSFMLAVAGAWKKDVFQLGGQYAEGSLLGDDWSNLDSTLSSFNGKGAILIASVENGILNGKDGSGLSITMGGNVLDPFLFGQDSYFPNNHYPVKNDVSDFLFFDLGNIFGPFSYTVAKNGQPDGLTDIPDFQGSGSGDGVIKYIY
ncbi:choice-of-anchor N protein [Allochromatium palmeri]|uniref:PEP-CTERM sorting domain-containing protein n=1 Tax=Allochromatium palmeri TaxID=231048 RepID=A0A6N8EJ51_9GAMM|nr:choice-of-anchor N protein [Allochromatium palmeri]MTW22537.1 hypothetical protein [Allochromatium palmeri]